jgi:hypothetical protein
VHLVPLAHLVHAVRQALQVPMVIQVDQVLQALQDHPAKHQKVSTAAMAPKAQLQQSSQAPVLWAHVAHQAQAVW